MPFDNLNFKETAPELDAPEPFTLPHFLAWLRTMPADGAYDWIDCSGGCLVGLYGRAQGADITTWAKFHAQLYNAGKLGIAGEPPYTFGAALTRARTLLDQ